MDIYQAVLRPIVFSGLKTDPEFLHKQFMQISTWLDCHSDRPPSSWILNQLQQNFSIVDARLEQTIWDCPNQTEVRSENPTQSSVIIPQSAVFKNPMGLAAGFDKNGKASGVWSSFGFGYAELGTVTMKPQPGNPTPRLFRLLADKGALNRMGFNNDGAAAMATALTTALQRRPRLIPIGINLGKSKVTPLEEAAADYLGSFRLLKDLGDYFVVNVSSPNTPGLRTLQDAPMLGAILSALQQENQKLNKPILVKIAPDLEWDAILDVLDVTLSHNLAGIIATNTTISREGLKTKVLRETGNLIKDEAGGISGLPLKARSTQVIRFIRKETKGKLPIMGVGGIFTADDAWEKITAGACLLQTYTGWIYQGPFMVKRILEGLLLKLEERGLSNISQAVGLEEN
ncbi:quinone-dependent dihydroorotate dehydrogenase [Floridanema evergladense]|uniref:Dihydroorotate dehydrogenase (quinone) n=1 Tax=Floridaenema evergladense BLCC-F167 TaxID=3153639 RepID=A0ABV4WP72_9CYAN